MSEPNAWGPEDTLARLTRERDEMIAAARAALFSMRCSIYDCLPCSEGEHAE